MHKRLPDAAGAPPTDRAQRRMDAFRQRRAWSGPAYPPPRPVFERGPTRQPPPTFKECIAFTAPALAIYVAGPLMSLIDAGFVGRRSSFELAALGPAGTISDSMTTLLVFLSVATTDLVARARCGGDDDGATSTRRRGRPRPGYCWPASLVSSWAVPSS